MGKSKVFNKGFTIVELLIVIVVIGILAAIVSVAYNGVQTKAKNSQTVNAVASWVKAMEMYKVDNGNYPTVNSCLGNANTYANESNGVCWGADTSTTWQFKPALATALSDYMSSLPEPSSQNINTAADVRRGAMYYYSSPGGEEIRVSIIGITSQSECPSIGGLNSAYGAGSTVDGRSCYYRLPSTP